MSTFTLAISYLTTSNLPWGSSFILLNVQSQFSQHCYWRDYPFPIGCPWHLCNRLIELYTHGFVSGVSTLFHWSLCLFSCQYSTVLIFLALFKVWNEEWEPPALFFPFVALAFRASCASVQIIRLFYLWIISGILIEIALNLWVIALNSVNILIMLVSSNP